MVSAEEAKHRPLAVISLVAVLLATNAAFGYGYLSYRATAAEQEAAARRAESANADLQAALDHTHDRAQRWVQQLSADNRDLLDRLSMLEQRVATLRPELSKPPTAAGRTAPPPAPTAATPRPSPADIQGALTGPSGPGNFTAPGWVPDYFSNESGAMTGSETRRERRPHRRQSSLRSTPTS
jgi:hypothetical protein